METLAPGSPLVASSAPAAPLPRLRSDLRWTEEEGGALLVEDPILERQARFQGREAALLRALRGEPHHEAELADPAGQEGNESRGLHHARPQHLGELEGRLLAAGHPAPSPAGELHRFLQALTQLHLLETSSPPLALVRQMRELLQAPLPDRPVRSQPLTPSQAAQLPLLYHPGIRYRCSGCGVCCHSFILGPLRPADVERLEQLRWPPGVRLPVGQQALHMLEDEGEEVPFLRTFRGACVYLSRDGLCEIHRQHGEAVKPLVCRLFPYRFVRLGQKASARVAVSIQFESMALWEGHAAGPALEAEEPYLRQLLAELGAVPALPEHPALTPTHRVPLRQALRADHAALELLERSDPGTSPAELARRIMAPFRELLPPPRRGTTPAAPPPLSRWLAAQLAWQQELETGFVPLLEETREAQAELLHALERRAAGSPCGDPRDPLAAAYLRSWLLAMLHGRDAYFAPDLLTGWIRNLLRLAVTTLLAHPNADAPGLPWIKAGIRASKLFQVGHSPDRPALAILADCSPRDQLEAVLGWLGELEEWGTRNEERGMRNEE